MGKPCPLSQLAFKRIVQEKGKRIVLVKFKDIVFLDNLWLMMKEVIQ